jgi:hypothetical protein
MIQYDIRLQNCDINIGLNLTKVLKGLVFPCSLHEDMNVNKCVLFLYICGILELVPITQMFLLHKYLCWP